jgi:hypothetical protein
MNRMNLPRPKLIRIDGDVAYVTLTKGQVAVIDAADVPLVEKWAWHAVQGRHGGWYAQRSAQQDGKRFHVSMHRLIAGAAPEQDVDHRDADGLNNRRSNLRCGSTRQNMGNMRLLARNKLGVKGVTRNKVGSYVAYISRNKRSIYLGSYKTVEEAKAAYDAAARAEFGDFARSR